MLIEELVQVNATGSDWRMAAASLQMSEDFTERFAQ